VPTRIVNLASGSKGNATCVLSGIGGVLVDCGLSRRETLRRLATAGIPPAAIGAILLTHEHTDHVRGAARVASALDVPLWMTAGTARRSGLGARPTTRVVVPGESLAVAGLRVLPLATSHNAADSCAYRLDGPHGAALLVTDLGTADNLPGTILTGLDVLYVEANHDPDLLRDGPYPAFLKRRIAGPRGHLNNRQCGELVRLARRLSPGLHTVALAHLSEQNNDPDLALATVRETCGDVDGVHWLVARQDEPTEILRKGEACA